LQLDEVDDCIVLRQLLQTNSDLIYGSGYVKPIANATVSDKNEIRRAVFLHQTIFHSMAEWEQLRRGLNVLGLCDEMKKNPEALLDFFTSVNKRRLTAGMQQFLSPRSTA